MIPYRNTNPSLKGLDENSAEMMGECPMVSAVVFMARPREMSKISFSKFANWD